MDPLATAIVTEAGKQVGEVVKDEAKTFLSVVLGEPARALGGLFADYVNARRHENLSSIVSKALQRLKEAGLNPKAVPLKIIHPLLEEASLEEEPELQDRWANLLANAAKDNPTNDANVLYAQMLKELSSREVRFLDTYIKAEHAYPGYSFNDFDRAYPFHHLVWLYKRQSHREDPKMVSDPQGYEREFKIVLAVVIRNGIFRTSTFVGSIEVQGASPEESPQEVPVTTSVVYQLTELGRCFIAACQAPS